MNDAPKWLPPFPYGASAAQDTAATVVTPLLAGFALTLIGLVIASEDRFRWPGFTVLLLTGAVVLLVHAVQLGIWMRQYAVRPDELREWRPDLDAAGLANIQRGHLVEQRKWRNLFAAAYHAGIVLLLFGLAAALAPADDVAGELRWIAAGVAVLGALAEVAWLLFRPPADAGRTPPEKLRVPPPAAQ